jgi:L-lactate dehydrogenase
MDAMQIKSKVVVIGTGQVGAAYAFALTVSGAARQLGLVNDPPETARGVALDLTHGLSLLRPMDIEAGGFELCRDAALVVITAGAPQKPGQGRLELAAVNAAIIKDVVAGVLAENSRPLLCVVTNPVDVLTHIALKESKLPPGRVFGSGTVLDSSRFRWLLSRHCGLDPRSIHAQILGEHGDSEFAAWSRVNVAGVPFEEFCRDCAAGCSADARQRLIEEVRGAAYEVIRLKGATAYAIALALVRITQAVLADQKSVLTVSSLVDGHYGLSDVCLALPCVVGSGGVEQVIPASLAPDELAALRASAAVLRQSLAALGY